MLKVLTAAMVVIAAAALACGSSEPKPGPNDNPLLIGVPAGDLESGGYQLEAPSGDPKPSIDADQAASIAARSNHPPVRQATLALLTETYEPHNLNHRLVWIINADVSETAVSACGGGQIQRSDLCEGAFYRDLYLLTFVDANTGEWLFQIEKPDQSSAFTVTPGPADTTVYTNPPTPSIAADIDFGSSLLPLQGIRVNDPTGEPAISVSEAHKVLGAQAPQVIKAEIVDLTLSGNPNGTRKVTGKFLAWALELERQNVRNFLDTFECNGWAYPGAGGFNQVVVFVDANDRRCLGFFISQSSDMMN